MNLDDPFWVYRFYIENPPMLMILMTLAAMVMGHKS